MFKCFRKIAKSDCQLRHVCLSVRPHGTTLRVQLILPKVVRYCVKKNIVQPDRPQMTIWRTRFAYWVTKAADTH